MTMISPKVVSIHTPDASSPEAVVRDIIRPGMTQEEKALAVWEYCWKHTWHWPAPKDDRRATHELDVVFDVNKLLNVYGYSYCFAIRALGEALYEAAGLEARSGGIGGHVIAEVWYDGKYHFLDHDQRGFSRLADGSIASAEDYRGRGRELVLAPKSPSTPFFPAVRRPLMIYEQKRVFAGYMLNHAVHYSQHDKYRSAHSMNLALLPGMRFTRSWKNCGKWNPAPGLVEEVRANGYADLWKGPHEFNADLFPEAARLDDGSPLTYGNGLLVWRPDLSRGAGQFERCALASANVDASGPGFRPARAGRVATADFRVRLPYVIVGWPGDFTRPIDPTGAAVVSGRCLRRTEADAVRVLVSADSLVTWTEVWNAPAPGEQEFAVDISKLVAGRYSYAVRFELVAARKAQDAQVLALGLDTACQLNPAVLPAVRPGRNRMTVTFEPGPEVFDEVIQYFDPADHRRLCVAEQGVEVEKGTYPALQPVGRGQPGSAVYAMRAPQGRLLRWAKAGGAFRSHPDVVAAPDEAFRIWYAVDRPGGWKLLWEADRAPYLGHWCFETDQEIPLVRPARAVFVKYELVRSVGQGEGGKMVAARLAWGCSPEGGRVPRQGVRLTHTWREDGRERSLSRVVARSGQAYSFAVNGRRVENLCLSMEIAGRGPSGQCPHPLMEQAPKIKPTELADPKRVGPMREALRRLDESPTAGTAADIMWNCASEMTRGVMPPALMAIGGEEARAELARAVGKLGNARGCLLELLSFEGPAADLAAFLDDRAPGTRADAATLLARKGDRSAAAALRAAVAREKDPGALAAELAALVRLEGQCAVAEAVKALPELAQRGRIRLAGELARIGAAEGLPVLAEAAKSANRYVRCEAAGELAACGRAEAEPLLLAALADESRWVRRAALVGLAAVGGKASLKPLARVAAKEAQPDLRGEAKWARSGVEERLKAGRR